MMVRRYRTNIPPKFCLVCSNEIKNKCDDHHYFCTVNCYTRFRTGIGVDYNKLVCIFPKNEDDINNDNNNKDKGPKPGFVDYTRFNFCRRCRLKLNKIQHPRTCPQCGFRISTRKRNKLRKSGVNNNSKEIVIIDDRIRIADGPTL